MTYENNQVVYDVLGREFCFPNLKINFGNLI